MNYKFLIIIMFFLITSLLSCSLDFSSNSSRRWVMAYYVGYQHGKAQKGLSQQNPDEINYKYLTHIAIGIILAKNDGSLDLRFYHNTEEEGKRWAKEVIDLAHSNKRKALLMLGGAENGANILNSMKYYKQRFINNLVNIIKELNADGIDLDWEDNIDSQLFIELAKEIRQKLPKTIITVPGSMLNSNYENAQPWLSNLAVYIDQYNIMSYYPGTAWIGSGWYSWHTSPLKGEKPNTPISISDTLSRLAKVGIPKSKLGMGIGFYAIGYSGGITEPNQITEWGQVEIRGGDNYFPIWKLFNEEGLQLQSRFRKWDSNAFVPYLSLDDNNAINGCKYISYEDEKSIFEKGKFAKENGYGGIIIWTISQGHIAENPEDKKDPLLKACYEAFIK